MQMICSIFKVFVFLPVVFCGLGSDFIEWHSFRICFLCLWWFQQSRSPPKLCLCFCVLDAVEDESVVVFEARVELNWASDYCDLILIWTKKPSNTHALSTSCPQIVTHSGMNRKVAIVCYMGQHVGWCEWQVTQKSRYWHQKIGNISCLNSHFLSKFMLKWSLYHHMSFCIVCYWCLRITSSFEDLGLPLDTEQPFCSVRTDSEVQIYLRWQTKVTLIC